MHASMRISLCKGELEFLTYSAKYFEISVANSENEVML